MNYKTLGGLLALTLLLVTVVIGAGLALQASINPNLATSVSPSSPVWAYNLSTPEEIAKSGLASQIYIFRKEGFNEECLQNMEAKGKACLEQCMPEGLRFHIQVALDLPECYVVGCICGDRDE